MSLSTNTTYRVYVEKLGSNNTSQFIGDAGEVFYDPLNPQLRISDGNTAGGVALDSSVGHFYFSGNSETVVSGINVWTKIDAETIEGDNNVGFAHTYNRLTCTSNLPNLYSVSAVVCYNSFIGPSLIQFGLYDSNVGIRTSSVLTHNAAASSNDFIVIQDVVKLKKNDYIEIHVQNCQDTNSPLVAALNLIITKI